MLGKFLLFLGLVAISKAKEEANLDEFPWMVSLRLQYFTGHDCGGAILNEVIFIVILDAFQKLSLIRIG